MITVSKNKKYLVRIQYARIIMMILVFFEHFVYLACWGNTSIRFLKGGSEAVTFFFVLSAFVDRMATENQLSNNLDSSLISNIKNVIKKHKFQIILLQFMFLISYIYYLILNIIAGFSLNSFFTATIWLLTNSTGLCVINPVFLNLITGTGWYMIDLLVCKCICLEHKVPKGLWSVFGLIGIYAGFVLLLVFFNCTNIHYYLYYFPLIRIIEYKVGQILYDIFYKYKDALRTHSLSFFILSITVAISVHIYIFVYPQLSDVSGIILLLSSCFLIFSLSLRDYTHPIQYPNAIRWICKHLYEFYLFHFIFAEYLMALPIRYPSFWMIIVLDVFALIVFAFIQDLAFKQFKLYRKKGTDS